MAITLNLQGVDSMLSQQRKKSIQFKTANQAMMAMDKFVPKSNMQKQNRLRTATHVSDDGHSIIYTMPYAKAQFLVLSTARRLRIIRHQEQAQDGINV
ncbi:minor capsid protein [Leuconostoc citreum]